MDRSSRFLPLSEIYIYFRWTIAVVIDPDGIFVVGSVTVWGLWERVMMYSLNSISKVIKYDFTLIACQRNNQIALELLQYTVLIWSFCPWYPLLPAISLRLINSKLWNRSQVIYAWQISEGCRHSSMRCLKYEQFHSFGNIQEQVFMYNINL